MTKTNEPVIELTPIEKIKPYANNAKKHSSEQISTLAGLMRKFGFNQPILVDADGEIIAGHGRRLAAIKLGLKIVPVIWRRDLTRLEAAALRLADNRVVSNDFDTMMEQAELIVLEQGGISIEELSYSPDELAFLVKDLGEIDDQGFVDDVSGAVEKQKNDNQADAGLMDKSAAPVGDALGFKRVTVEQSRTIRGFMSVIEKETGFKGVDALMAHIGASA